MTTMPKPEVWPVCTANVPARNYQSAHVCNTPFVLRYTYSLTSGGMEWLWMRDCKHKRGMHEMHDANGRVDAALAPAD